MFLRVLLACCWLCSSLFTGSRVPSLAVLFTGSRVPSLAVSLSSRPFGSCFIQPTIHQPTMHPLGLKASGVHDHCKRRRGEHRINNLLNTLHVKDLLKMLRCAFCLQAHTANFVSNGLPSIPAQARHSDLEHSRARGRPQTHEFCCTALIHLSSHHLSLSSSQDFKHQCQLLFQNRRSRF